MAASTGNAISTMANRIEGAYQGLKSAAEAAEQAYDNMAIAADRAEQAAQDATNAINAIPSANGGGTALREAITQYANSAVNSIISGIDKIKNMNNNTSPSIAYTDHGIVSDGRYIPEYQQLSQNERFYLENGIFSGASGGYTGE
jgi:hypothetical protein